MSEEENEKGKEQEENEKGKEQEENGYSAHEYIRMMRTLTKIQEYVYGGSAMNLKMRNEALETGNEMAFHYFQGGLDVCTDIKSILEGYELKPVNRENTNPGMMHR